MKQEHLKLKKGAIRKIIGYIILLVTIVIAILSILDIKRLDIVPDKYFFILIGIEVLFIIILFFLLRAKKIVWFIIGIIIVIGMNTGNLIVSHYTQKTNKFINKTFKEYMLIKTDYVVITNSRNGNENMQENQNIYYFKYSRNVDLALKEVGEYTYLSTDSVSSVLDTMNANPNTYLLISKGDFDYIMESTILYDRDDYKIIKEFTVEYKEEVNNTVKDSYIIYLNGTDFTGIMRDFNLLITVNTKTKKILMTPILRGYYIDVPAYGMKDTLMCLGAYDSNVSKEALENLLDIKIDYTVNVNTNSLVDIVDTIGGVEFCSDYSFTTTHALVKDSYYDKAGKKLNVVAGCKEYNGIEALTISRERLHLKNNERGRIENCEKILMSIVKKSISTNTLLNFDEVLNSYSNLYTTDMNRNVITKLAKSFISDYSSYQVITQNLDGKDGVALGHMGTQEVGVTFPDENQVKEASIKIKKVLEGKK